MNKAKRHYPWWGYVRYMVRQYPVWREAVGEETPDSERAGWAAVDGAVEITEHMENGLARLKVIRMVHWDRTHTLVGAATEIPCDRATAARWQRRFFEEVARNRGLLD